MTFNVNRQIQDVFYRYKMPKLVTKIEGKGNGIKTVVVNMGEVSKALGRDPALPTKHFGVILGAQVQVDDKIDRYVVNGAHQSDKLQEILDGFIKNYVLCPKCQNPETEIRVKAKNVQARCKACGHQYPFKPDRITQYIIKNPPKKESSKHTTQPTNEEEGSDDVEDEGDEAGDMIAAAQGSDSTVSSPTKEEEVVWRVDASEEAASKRTDELTPAVRNMTVDTKVESLGMHERANLFLKYLRDNVSRQVCGSEEISVERAKAVKSESDRLQLGYKSVNVCVEVLFNNLNTLIDDVSRTRNVFLRFTRSNVPLDQPQKAQTSILDCIFVLVETNASVLSHVTKLMEALYEADIIEEEVMLNWYEAAVRKKVKRKSSRPKVLDQMSPFIEWLKNAEEESDEDEESEDDSCRSGADPNNETGKSKGDDSGGMVNGAVIGGDNLVNDGVQVTSGASNTAIADSENVENVSISKSEASRLLEMDDEDDIDLNDI